MKNKVQRFEKILKTRIKGREEQQLLLSSEKKEEDRLVDLLRDLETKKKEALLSFGHQGKEPITVQEMWFCRKAIERVESTICDQGDVLCSVRTAIEETEARLVEKHRDVQIMEKYVSGLMDEWRNSVLKKEQIEMDDIAGIRHCALQRGQG